MQDCLVPVLNDELILVVVLTTRALKSRLHLERGVPRDETAARTVGVE